MQKRNLTKCYSQIRPKEEFNTFVGKHFQRVQCKYWPVVQGDNVSMIVSPTGGLPTHRKAEYKVSFKADAKVEVYPDRQVSRDEQIETYQRFLLESITPDLGFVSLDSILERLKGNFGTIDPELSRVALNRLCSYPDRNFKRQGKAGYVFYRRLRPEEHTDKWLDLMARYKRYVLQALEGTDGRLLSVREIVDISTRLHCPMDRAKCAVACNQLVDEDVLFSRHGSMNLKYYRLPIPLEIGLPVVESLGTRSEAVGWIVAIDRHPIVQFLGGPRRYSSQPLLDLVSDSKRLQDIERAKQLAAGKIPSGFVKIPYYMFEGIVEWKVGPNKKRRPRTNANVIKEIGVYAGIWDPAKNSGSNYNSVIDFLEAFYPRWKEGDCSSVADHLTA